ncbi:hypothetical protein MES4922_30336 [Mesorhizobium ventifaucium]|uniref:MFS transporter n=1 Tax=Mesorhizobium ventifaucium TaxID=666020 RepID=A0ABN8JY44_9HYPH|nr:hypothetical protein MES4922_30336 [Mesorhizobium ventifaucium]
MAKHLNASTGPTRWLFFGMYGDVIDCVGMLIFLPSERAAHLAIL